jgi:hypothetical protein
MFGSPFAAAVPAALKTHKSMETGREPASFRQKNSAVLDRDARRLKNNSQARVEKTAFPVVAPMALD